MSLTQYILHNEHLIKMICDIFTAGGTFGAVVLSLYLSYRSNHPKPKIRGIAEFQFWHQETDLPGTDGIPIISVDLGNLSRLPIEINAFGWSFELFYRYFDKKISYQFTNELVPHTNSLLPITIPYGHNVQYMVSEGPFVEKVRNLFPLNKCFPFINFINAFFTYLFIQDSIGNFYYFRVRKSLRTKILEYCR